MIVVGDRLGGRCPCQRRLRPSAATLSPGGTPSDAWSRFANIGGLIVDQTRLGDELSLLHDRTEIAASIFAGMQDWRWRGTAFKP